jgi:hypothetical protein
MGSFFLCRYFKWFLPWLGVVTRHFPVAIAAVFTSNIERC